MAKGLLDHVSSFISQLTSGRPGKRKNEQETPRQNKKAKIYEITPGRLYSPKQIEAKRVMREFYTLHEIVSTTEDRNYEFKAGGALMNGPCLYDYMNKYGSAFLNSEGGVLIGGVLDTGKVSGLTIRRYKQDWLCDEIRAVFDKFRPRVTSDLYRVTFVPIATPEPRFRGYDPPLIPDLYVVEIHIKKGSINEIYETADHKVFMRRDGGVQGPLRPLQIRDLVITKYKMKLKQRQNDSEKKEAEKESRKKRRLEDIDEAEEPLCKSSRKEVPPDSAAPPKPPRHAYSNPVMPRTVISPIVFDAPRPNVQKPDQSRTARGFGMIKDKFKKTFSRR